MEDFNFKSRELWLSGNHFFFLLNLLCIKADTPAEKCVLLCSEVMRVGNLFILKCVDKTKFFTKRHEKKERKLK